MDFRNERTHHSSDELFLKICLKDLDLEEMFLSRGLATRPSPRLSRCQEVKRNSLLVKLLSMDQESIATEQGRMISRNSFKTPCEAVGGWVRKGRRRRR